MTILCSKQMRKVPVCLLQKLEREKSDVLSVIKEIIKNAKKEVQSTI